MRPHAMGALIAAAMLAAPPAGVLPQDRDSRPNPLKGLRKNGMRRAERSPWGSREQQRRARQIARGILQPTDPPTTAGAP